MCKQANQTNTQQQIALNTNNHSKGSNSGAEKFGEIPVSGETFRCWKIANI